LPIRVHPRSFAANSLFFLSVAPWCIDAAAHRFSTVFAPFFTRLLTVFHLFYRFCKPPMKINGTPLASASTQAQLVMNQLADSAKRFLVGGRSSTANDHQRDQRGRFTLGCRPGPGRPRKIPRRQFVPPLQLYQRCLDMDHSVIAWKSIVNRLGPAGAREFLSDLEAEQGPISFRDLALKAIAAGEQTGLKQNRADDHLSDSKGAPKNKRQSHGRRRSKK
jgi:hypothetical protein